MSPWLKIFSSGAEIARTQYKEFTNRRLELVWSLPMMQWRNALTGGPWTNYIKGPIHHFEFTEEFIIIKVLKNYH